MTLGVDIPRLIDWCPSVLPVVVSSISVEEEQISYHNGCSSLSSSRSTLVNKASISPLDGQLNSLEGELIAEKDPRHGIRSGQVYQQSRVSLMYEGGKKTTRRTNEDVSLKRERHW